MADKKLVTLYGKSGAKVQVSEAQVQKLKARGYTTTAPKS